MSVSGPCLWLPSPAASSSHFSAIPTTATTASAANTWTPEQNFRSQTEKTEDPVLPAVSSTTFSTATNTPVQAELMPPKNTDDRTVPATTDSTLSRTRLEKLNCSEPFLSSGSKDATSSTPATRESSLERKRKHSDSNLHDKEIFEGAMTPSDDGAGSSAAGERQNTPADGKIEKKKMKRFR